jgi:hypothetical protein
VACSASAFPASANGYAVILGATLRATIDDLVDWAERHTTEIDSARAVYDACHAVAAET